MVLQFNAIYKNSSIPASSFFVFLIITKYKHFSDFFYMNFLLLLYATIVKFNQIKNVMNRENLCCTNTFLEMLCEVHVCDVEEFVFGSGQNSKKLQLPLRVHVIV